MKPSNQQVVPLGPAPDRRGYAILAKTFQAFGQERMKNEKEPRKNEAMACGK